MTTAHPLVRVAREAIAAHLRGERYVPPPLAPHLDHPAGVFVTLRKGEALRGCIGHVEPAHPRRADEVAACACLAGFSDPRFPPLQPAELAEVTIEVSVLHAPVPVTDTTTLDPRRYGVIVRCGQRRGLLLPDIPTVDTIEDQLAIALRKAGIGRDEPWIVERFEVEKFKEVPDP